MAVVAFNFARRDAGGMPGPFCDLGLVMRLAGSLVRDLGLDRNLARVDGLAE